MVEYPEMSRNFEWFVEHYAELQQQCGDCWVVIRDCCICGVYPSVGNALDEALRTGPYGTFNVQQISTTHKAYMTYCASNFRIGS